MKKYATKYLVEGTSALRLEASETAEHEAEIIVFPGPYQSDHPSNPSSDSSCFGDHSKLGRIDRNVLRSQFVTELRSGDAAGKPFDRMNLLQATVGGFTLCATAFFGLFLAL